MPEIIDDAPSFTRHILKNRFQSQEDINAVEQVLDEQFKDRKKAADGDNRAGSIRDKYFFFQGAVMGMLIAFKQVKLHYENSAWEQGVDPMTGDTITNHGNAS